MAKQEPTDGTQASQILFHLQAGTVLTPILAMRLIQPPILRLAARIHQLRQLGYDIKTTPYKTRIGAVVASYSLVRP